MSQAPTTGSRRRRRAPRRFYFLLGALAAGTVAFLLYRYAGLHWLPAALIGWNIATFGLYGYDKASARAEGPRVPEVVLHAFALLGGSPAAYLAQRLFRHKTLKGSFRFVFWAVVAVQVALLLWWAWSKGLLFH